MQYSINAVWDTSTAEWRPIPGLEGFYEASEEGQIRSLPRKATRGKILTSQINNSGYARVSVTCFGKSRYLYVHHLVALAFVGPRPPRHDVNHINGVKTDNRACNLNYMTRTENMKHARQTGLHDNRGEKMWNAKLTNEQAIEILWAAKYCGLAARDMKIEGVSERTIRDVLERKTWKHINEQEL